MAPLKTDKEIIELIDNFFAKSTLLICSTKSSRLQTPSDQVPQFDEEWFSSQINEDLDPSDIIKQWSSFDGEKELPPLVIETFLDLRQLGPSHWITLKDDEGNLWNVCKGTKKTEIVLERWLIELDRNSASFKSHKPSDEDASNLPRQLILLFRYLYTLIQLLPANDLYLSLSKGSVLHNSSPIVGVATRILDGSKPILSKGRIGLSKPIISTYSNVVNESNMPSHLEQRKITPVWTRFGLLRVSVSYRHDCHFEVHDGEEEYHNNQYLPEPTARRLSANRSMSLSPQTHAGSMNSMDQNSSQRKPVFISRQLQPFKVGSVGSAPVPQSQTLTRNPSSSSSISANLQAQRSSNSLGVGNLQTQLPPQDIYIESTSVGSASKYSSSFGRIRRHSSTKYSDHIDKPAKPIKQADAHSEDLLDFVKLIDEKPELKIKRNPAGTMDISNSLMKFQNLKPTNDFISENLNLSMSMDPSHVNQRHRSNSHSPIPSFSPSINYPSIPSRFSQTHLNESVMALASRRNSTETPKPNIASFHGSSVSSNRLSIDEKESSSYNESINDVGNEDDDDDLLMNQALLSNSRLKRYNSPRSVESVSSSIPRNRLAIVQPSQYSQPTTSAVPAYAKLHRPGVRRTEILEKEPKKEDTDNPDKNSQREEEEEEEDEDLLFFMSDMNLSKI